MTATPAPDRLPHQAYAAAVARPRRAGRPVRPGPLEGRPVPRRRWAYEGVVDGWTHVYEPLPVLRLASPAALRALVPAVLTDRYPAVAASAEKWREPGEADALRRYLAAADAAREASA
ncbi:hypothetical protein ACFVGY_28155 [Streptomyces sp. NPDC127106]|uniref:hypothetical protein n=1 Tax=Streptomyces sp. NPDC127106 TaxID=3345360 RepID=UPI00362E58EC